MQYDVLDIELSKLYDYGRQIIEKYKEELKIVNAVASEDLLKSIEWTIKRVDDNTLTLEMSLFDYWYYIEYGRNPSVGNSEWENPIQDLTRWIRYKINQGSLIPKPDYQIPTTQKEIVRFANAIYSKVTKYGFYEYNVEGKHPLENTLKKSIADGLVDKFCNAVGGELANEIVVELNKLSVRPIPKPKRPKNI